MQARDIHTLLDESTPHRVTVLPTVDSTNTYLRKLAAEGAPDGTAVIAEAQTAGRGRLSRQFASPAGAGLYMSILLRREIPLERLPLLTPFAAVAAARAVERLAPVSVGIKWVNDLRIGERKIAGILTEGGFSESGELAYAVLGVGINLLPNALPRELQEIAAAIGDFAPPPSPAAMAAALLNELFLGFAGFTDGSFLEEYRRRSVVLGRTVTASDGERTVIGRAEEIEDDGALRLLTEEGVLHLRAGEVSIRL